jgi:hypothetical protein
MNRMKLEATRTDNTAPAKGVVDLAMDPTAVSPLEGLLVALNTSSVGSRGSGKKAKTGIAREDLGVFLDDYLRTVEAQGADKPEEAASFLANLFVHLAYTRDLHDGKGERDLAYWTIMHLWRYYPETIKLLLPMLTWETYGSFKDLNRLLELCTESLDERHRSLAAFLTSMWSEALRRDRALLQGGTTSGLSLAGKWAPRQDSHTAKACPNLVFELAWSLRDDYDPEAPTPTFDPTSGHHSSCLKAYRTLCSALNGQLGTPEVAMCAGAWESLDPTRIPGRCHTMRRKALLNQTKGKERRSDKDDRIACAAKFIALYDQVRLNPVAAAERRLLKTETLTPFDLVGPFVECFATPSPTLEAQWTVFVEAQRARFASGGGLIGGVAMADVSGSMRGVPLQACVAFSLLLAHLMPEPWRGQIMTFSSKPAWHTIPLEASLLSQVRSIQSAHWQMSTDFAKAMDLILKTGVENRVPADQMPKVIYVFTDMQFDQAQPTTITYQASQHVATSPPAKWETVHDTVAERFAKAGYEMPFIVYWNLAGDTRRQPNYQVSSSTPSTAMLSGFSTSAFDAFCSGDPLSLREAASFERLMKLLDRECYDRVRQVCAASSEGSLAPYTWTPRPIEVVTEGGDVCENDVEEETNED